jgi:tRNA pseudouridine38-40 synthase
MDQRHYRVVIAYKGSHYFGWQYLGDGGDKPTVQFEVLQALRKISKYAACVVAGASRTDAGVHALGQVAKLSTALQIDPDKLKLGLNSLLPKDIRILECKTCGVGFNPNKQAMSKTYRYFFTVDHLCAPVLGDLVGHVPLVDASDPEGPLERMQSAGQLFIGEHDFAGFSVRDTSGKSSIRSILSLELIKAAHSEFGPEVYYFEIKGSGFLKYMVRYIVGSLFEVGRLKIDAAAIEAALIAPNHDKLSPKAKAKGLHLIKIDYES